MARPKAPLTELEMTLHEFMREHGFMLSYLRRDNAAFVEYFYQRDNPVIPVSISIVQDRYLRWWNNKDTMKVDVFHPDSLDILEKWLQEVCLVYERGYATIEAALTIYTEKSSDDSQIVS